MCAFNFHLPPNVKWKGSSWLYNWHLIILPPPPKKKKGLFFFLGGGGVAFLGYFHEFLSWRDIAWHEETLGQAGIFEGGIGRFWPIPADLPTFEISKITHFGVIGGKFWDFFFQNSILVQICPEMTKNCFFEVL